MPISVYEDGWKTIIAPSASVEVSGSWKTLANAYVYQSGWKLIYDGTVVPLITGGSVSRNGNTGYSCETGGTVQYDLSWTSTLNDNTNFLLDVYWSDQSDGSSMTAIYTDYGDTGNGGFTHDTTKFGPWSYDIGGKIQSFVYATYRVRILRRSNSNVESTWTSSTYSVEFWTGDCI